MEVSVIIPTINRPFMLKRCLYSIRRNTSTSLYEVVVVDSSTKESLREKTRKITKEYGGIYIYERRKGLSIARNTGIRNAKGDIIVFVDDDFIVRKNWLKNLLKNYKSNEVMAVTGRMIDIIPNEEISNILKETITFDRGSKGEYSQKKILV